VKYYEGTYLTERQVRVLKYLASGLSKSEIARRLNVSRATVVAILKSAESTIERCRRTIELYESIVSICSARFPPGTSVDRVVEEIYKLADSSGVKVSEKSYELYKHIVKSLKGKVVNGVLKTGAVVSISKDGRVTITPLKTCRK
jgi:Tfx family DNA-binding protein